MNTPEQCFNSIDIKSPEFEKICREYALLEPLVSGYLEGKELENSRRRAREEIGCSARTLRRKLKILRTNGLSALAKKVRNDKGSSRTVTPAIVNRVVELIKENPSRSVRKALGLLEFEKKFKEQASKITVSGVLRSMNRNGIELRHLRNKAPQEPFRSFAADFANQLWQADSRMGISIPDPDNPKKKRKTKLFLWLDDYSRMVIYGRYYFDETLPHLEASFRQAVLRHGLCKRLYCDNGSTYISKHFTLLTERLGIRKIHHPPYCAYCKGKVEVCNKFIKNDFQSEAALADIKTIDELNSAFEAWYEVDYNRKIHTETGEAPRSRYLNNIEKVPPKRITDLDKFERLFLWDDNRVVDKYGIISFEGNKYRASGCALGEHIKILFNPFNLSSIELWRNKRFIDVVKANKVQHIRVKTMPEEHKREKGKEISRNAQRYLAKLREKLNQERAEGADNMQAFLKLKEEQ